MLRADAVVSGKSVICKTQQPCIQPSAGDNTQSACLAVSIKGHDVTNRVTCCTADGGGDNSVGGDTESSHSDATYAFRGTGGGAKRRQLTAHTPRTPRAPRCLQQLLPPAYATQRPQPTPAPDDGGGGAADTPSSSPGGDDANPTPISVLETAAAAPDTDTGDDPGAGTGQLDQPVEPEADAPPLNPNVAKLPATQPPAEDPEPPTPAVTAPNPAGLQAFKVSEGTSCPVADSKQGGSARRVRELPWFVRCCMQGSCGPRDLACGILP